MKDDGPPAAGDYRQLLAYAEDLRRLLAEREANQAQLRAYVTDLQQLLQEREAARSEVDAALATKERLLDCVSDDLRAPLTSILGFCQVLLHEPQTPQTRDYLQRILQAGQQLAARIERLLTSASLQRQALGAQPSACRLDQLLRALADEYRPRAQARGLSLALQLPARATPALSLDPGKLTLALRALLDNALKFAPAGCIALRLEQAEGDPAPTWIQVEDQGPGLAEDFLPQLFSPFSQADSSPARRYDGAGLGLSMARALLQLCGCELFYLPPAAGAGTRFRISLPNDCQPSPPEAG